MPDQLHLNRLELDCIVGVRPSERKRRQRIRLDVSLSLDLRPAGRSGRIVQTVDYSRVAGQLRELLRFREYRLVEMATEELSAMLFASHPALEGVQIRLEKPEALRGQASSAAVSISRTRADFPLEVRELAQGRVARVLATHEATLELVTLESHARFALVEARRLAWLAHGSLIDCDAVPIGEVLPPLTSFAAGAEGAALFVCELVTSGVT